MAHTPGPWWVNMFASRRTSGEVENFEILADDEFPICDMVGTGSCTLANAHLIASAPDMLHALEDIASLLDDENYDARNECIAIARTAIKKTKGGQ